MEGINMNTPILYKHASLRFFAVGEHHITRRAFDDVLLLVYEGTLRFTEEGREQEVSAGEYYIQRRDLYQQGPSPSDAPKYLYVHFRGEWTDTGAVLPVRGNFDIKRLLPTMEKLDAISHRPHTYIEGAREFYTILTRLSHTEVREGVACEIAEYLSANYTEDVSLEEICTKFNFSKNHVINLFKWEYGVTPVCYLNELRLSRAMYLLEVTSDTIERVAYESGFRDYSHFYRQFYRKNGVSPQQWREKKQKQI